MVTNPPWDSLTAAAAGFGPPAEAKSAPSFAALATVMFE
jgi:hypothetical protein